MIPYGKQDISQGDIDSVVEVLKSDFLTQGPAVPAFQSAVAEYCSARYAVAVNSATSALHIACLALGVGHGDWVWTTPVTFVASANCALYCGAKIDFVDIDPVSYNMSISALKSKLALAKERGRLPKVLIPVHLCGLSCDMEAIKELSNEYGFSIIEDASHAIGGKYKNSTIGSCQYSDITIFSFHPVKIITTAEGGMALTNSSQLAEKLELLRSHGVTRAPSLMTSKPDGPWYYQQIELGFNYRMTDLQAALGLSQLQRLDEFVAQRHKLAERYDGLLKDVAVVTPQRGSECYSGFHLYVIRLLDRDSGKHLEVFELLRAAGIGVNLHYMPIYKQPFYQKFDYLSNEFPESEKYYSTAISLPLYPSLSYPDQDEVVRALEKSL